jgi:hypothetical protein
MKNSQKNWNFNENLEKSWKNRKKWKNLKMSENSEISWKNLKNLNNLNLTNKFQNNGHFGSFFRFFQNSLKNEPNNGRFGKWNFWFLHAYKRDTKFHFFQFQNRKIWKIGCRVKPVFFIRFYPFTNYIHNNFKTLFYNSILFC